MILDGSTSLTTGFGFSAWPKGSAQVFDSGQENRGGEVKRSKQRSSDATQEN
jgi:hypothetical protein